MGTTLILREVLIHSSLLNQSYMWGREHPVSPFHKEKCLMMQLPQISFWYQNMDQHRCQEEKQIKGHKAHFQQRRPFRLFLSPTECLKSITVFLLIAG